MSLRISALEGGCAAGGNKTYAAVGLRGQTLEDSKIMLQNALPRVRMGEPWILHIAVTTTNDLSVTQMRRNRVRGYTTVTESSIFILVATTRIPYFYSGPRQVYPRYSLCFVIPATSWGGLACTKKAHRLKCSAHLCTFCPHPDESAATVLEHGRQRFRLSRRGA